MTSNKESFFILFISDIMKMRYLFIPMIIISLMLWIIDIDKDVLVNKVIINDNIEINYPYFNDNKIDNFINEYLDRYKDKNGIIDYDYDNNDNKYYVVFYKYFFDSNIYSYDLDSFMIDLDSSTISMVYTEVFNYDIITNKKINSSDKLIALTFDDGPNYNTNKVLDILEENNVPATFFVLGNRIKGNENILKRMVSSKMEIGNHTFNHLLLTKYKEDRVKSEINDTSNLIFEVTGKYPTLFRPSYGSCNKMIRSVVDTPIIIWDIDTLDWKYHNSRRISSRVINKVKDGDIVLMHDIYSATANALEIIIPSLKSKGYTFVTVSDLFYYKNIPLEKGKVYGFAR